MIPVRARQPQLARQILVSACRSRSALIIQRGFSASVPRRFNDTPQPEGVTSGKPAQSLNTHLREVQTSLRQLRHDISNTSHALDGWIEKRQKWLDNHKELGEIKGEVSNKVAELEKKNKETVGSAKSKTRVSALKKKTDKKGGDSVGEQKYIFVPDAEERVFNDLQWAGLEWSEGPDKGGPYAPYRQSERLEIYKDHTKTLLDNGAAYRCFCSHETLQANSLAAHEAGLPTGYPGTCRSLPSEESDKRAAAGEPHVVRLNSGKFGRPTFQDAIYGPFQKKQDEEDFVLMKTDGYPTYHLANVVDDHLMKITHVVRGEEWLISTPKHIALYEAFGWKPPTFAHLGLLVDNDGSKLSKRNASVDLSTYRQQNTFPLALQAWLANLGSSFRTKVPTARTLKEVADNLTFKFTRGGIKLNPEKLQFFQNEYISALFSTKPSESESDAIKKHLVAPLIDEVLTITKSPTLPLIQPPKATIPWPHPLELIPAMQTNEIEYTQNVLFKSLTKFDSSREVARMLPYLFWRPPLAVYRGSLAQYRPDRALFNIIDNAISNTSPEDFEAAENKIFGKLNGQEKSAAHDLIRLILVGDPEASSRSTKVMVDVLGQKECQHRISVVRGLLDELA
ncbi:Fc.00g003430.m01.CDS01 [Cosmosporella sp. VM-42]